MTLDPSSGAVVKATRNTLGGDFFYQLHFNLHYLPPIWGRWIVGVCAMFMLVAIVSGVITHKRIFVDFFTFRPRKGQRSWLDAHNVTAVLALPYHLMITYTGIVTLMFMYMPWAPQAVYKDDRRNYISEVFPTARGNTEVKISGIRSPMIPLGELVAKSRLAWNGSLISAITIQNPGDASARATVMRHESGGMSANQTSISYSAVDGRELSRLGEAVPPASNTRGVLYSLHLGRFAEPLLRWLFFLSGIAGCLMVASGLVLWAVKQRQKVAKAKAKGERAGAGLRLVESLNIVRSTAVASTS